MKNHLLYWRLCCVAVVVLWILTLTPVVKPEGVFSPKLMGLPYTLWMSMLVAFLMVLLTYIGSKVHPSRFKDEEEGQL